MRYVALVAVLIVSVSLSAAPRENRERGREKEPPVLKVIKRLVGSLGDFIVIPTPPPKP